MRIRFIKSYGLRVAGQEIDPPSMQANRLIRIGVAVLCDQSNPVVELQPQPAKRGRPRKIIVA